MRVENDMGDSTWMKLQKSLYLTIKWQTFAFSGKQNPWSSPEGVIKIVWWCFIVVTRTFWPASIIHELFLRWRHYIVKTLALNGNISVLIRYQELFTTSSWLAPHTLKRYYNSHSFWLKYQMRPHTFIASVSGPEKPAHRMWNGTEVNTSQP